MSAPSVNPKDDGKTHINCWSKGRTALGRELSNFANTPFKHPKYGNFVSVEGFWYWLATGQTDDKLRRLYGLSAKSYGSKLTTVPMEPSVFQKTICEAIRCKIAQNKNLRKAFAESTLPFRHYFTYGKHEDVVVEQEKHAWQMVFLETLRKQYKDYLITHPL